MTDATVVNAPANSFAADAPKSQGATVKHPKTVLILGVFGLFSLVGIACWIFQITQGLQVAHLDNSITWGLYIVGFLLFTGVAAGCLLFASAPFVFSSLAIYRPYAGVASFASVACGAVCAGLFIFADTGNPLRAFSILTSFQWMSPLFWDTIILLVYVLVGIAFTFALTKVARGEKNAESVHSLAVGAFVAGVLVAITAFAFALQVARPSWNHPGLILSFLLAAVVAGGSFLMLTYTLLDRSGYLSFTKQASRGFSCVVALFLCGELALALAEVVSGLYVGAGDGVAAVFWLVNGPGAPFFWFQMISSVAGIVLLLQKNGSLHVVGAIFSFIAIFLVKYNMLQSQLHNPLLGFAGPVAAPGILNGAYFPGLIEWGVALGVVSIGLLVFTAGLSKLKLGK